MAKDPIWTKQFLTIALINLLLTLVVFLLIVIIGVYAIETYSAEPSEAGLAAGIFVIGILLGRIAFGWLLNWRPNALVLRVSALSFCLISALYLFEAGYLEILLLIRFFHGLSLGLLFAILHSMIATSIPAGRMGEAISYFSLSVALASAFGPFMGLMVIQNLGYQSAFLICLGLSCAALMLCLFVSVPAAENFPGASEPFRLANMLDRRATPISMLAMLLAICFSCVLAYLNAYALELEVVAQASYFFLVYSVVVLVSRPFTGWMVDHIRPGLVVYPCFLSFFGGLLLLAAAAGGVELIMAAVLLGFGFGNLQSITQATAIKEAGREHSSKAISTFYIFFDTGMGVGPFVLGFIATGFGYRQLFVVEALLVVMVALLYALIQKRRISSATQTIAR